MRLTLGTATVLTTAALIAGPAAASTFVFESGEIDRNTWTGVPLGVTTSFDTETEVLTWSSTFRASTYPTAQNKNAVIDGAWLVVNDGGEPKGTESQYPIFYLDGLNDVVSMYQYDGTWYSDSWKAADAIYLGSVPLTSDRSKQFQTYSFELDATALNSRDDIDPNWQGVHFAEEVGIWFHGVEDLTAAYNADGSLAQFDYGKFNYYDVIEMPTVKMAPPTGVPEPSLLLGLGAISLSALGLRRRDSDRSQA